MIAERMAPTGIAVVATGCAEAYGDNDVRVLARAMLGG
jgi:hypothetical protein